MPTNFRIVPSSPEPVSGLALIDQIENAVNDLGGKYDDLEMEVNLKTEQALTSSQNAEAMAYSALQTAQDAETMANEAKNLAGSALNTASQAQVKADEASAKADSAYDQSTLALTDSQAALNISQTAITQSEIALEQSTSALQTAESAQTSSQAAMESARQANGTFIVDENTCDADSFFKSPEKKYLTNPSSTNFPGGVVFPGYFEIVTSNDDLSVAQKCGGSDAGQIFARTGSVNIDDPEVPTVAWQNWSTVGSGGLERGIIVMWSGAADQVPGGWALCDGQDGRPDLRNKFIIGSGDNYLTGDEGGSVDHQHGLPEAVGNTALTVNQMPRHSHSAINYSVGAPEYLLGGTIGMPFRYGSAYAGGGQAHNHTLGGLTESKSTLPPYYALAFIIKQ